MSEDAVPVTVRILDKEFRVACEPQEQEGLIESARLLDHRMREIRQTGRVIGLDRIAVMAALNIAHELLQIQQGQGKDQQDLGRRLFDLQNRLGEALATQPQLDEQSDSV
ncbi:MAG: cell division protein ZapA [Pseudomonadota bacterium]|nr:cell division protein ZapA [Pseudomonadota bacterium]